MQLQIRRFLPDGVTPQEVIDTARVRMADAMSASAALTFTVSIAVADGIRQWMEDNPGKPFVVGVEHSNGGVWAEPRNGRFVAYKGSADDLDPTGSQQIVCMDMVTWDLIGTYLHWAPGAKDNERTWYGDSSGGAASAGHIMAGTILESKNRGWAPTLLTDFTGTHDSDGAAWAAAEKVLQGWRLLTPLSQVLDSLSDQGLCEWWSEGRTLRLFRPGKGELRDNVVLGGAGFTRAPGSWDYSNVFTNLTVVPEKADMWLYLPNPGADATTGRREATVTQAGVGDHVTATTLAQPVLLDGRTAQREQSYEWQVVEGMPVPWVDFQVGDTVTILTTIGPRLERVVELAVASDEDGLVTAHAVTGDLIRSKAAKRNQATDNATVGGIVGGSGTPLPVGSPPALSDPLAPTGLRVASNVGSWREDGTAQAAVRLEWDAVSQTVDGSAVDIAAYEVAVRTPDSEPQVFATVTGLSVLASEWEPGRERLVRVRSRDHRGQVSAWSGEISVTPQVPASIVPKAVTGLAVSSNTAVFLPDGRAVATIAFGWSAVTQSVDNTLIDAAEYEFVAGAETQRVTGLTGSVQVPSLKGVTVKVRALSTLGVWGDYSAPLTVTGAAPAVALPAPAVTLVGGMGGVLASWNGLLAGAAPAAGFSRVVLEIGTSATGPWTVQGAPWVAAGTQSAAAPAGEKRWARARAFDTLGRAGAYSAVVEATASGVPLSAIPGLSEQLDDIIYTADGKNRIYVQAASPGVAAEARRNLIRSPLISQALAGWVLRGPEISDGGALASIGRTMLISGTVPSGSYLLSAPHPAPPAGGEKRSGSFTVQNPGSAAITLRAAIYWVGPNTYAYGTDLTISPGGKGVLRVEDATVPGGATGSVLRVVAGTGGVSAGQQFIVEDCTTLESSAVAGKGFTGASSHQPLTGYAWDGPVNASESIEYTSPFTPGDLWFKLDAAGTSVESIRVWSGVAWVPQVLYADSIIASGSITGTLIKAGTIQVDNLHPSVGDTINMTANGSIMMLVGRADSADTHLGALDGQVDAAQGTANAAQTAADAANAAAGDVSARLAQHQTYYRFGADGLGIGDPSAAAELRLKPSRIEMTQQGTVVSYWEGGVLVADETRLKRSIIGSHRFEEYGPGRTTIRPLQM